MAHVSTIIASLILTEKSQDHMAALNVLFTLFTLNISYPFGISCVDIGIGSSDNIVPWVEALGPITLLGEPM